MIKTILIVILSCICTATGHLLFKKSTNSIEFHSLSTFDGKIKFLKNIISRPTIWMGMLSITIGLVIWIFALASGDLSIVYPMSSMEYVIILFSAHFFIGEKVDKMKALGTFLVVLGIAFLTMS
jgi:uncharacterized membrane protein